MMDFFHEKLKEIERLCSREKGINAMSIKDVLMSLVYDGLVDTDKIGTCVYFWAFPSKATQKLKVSVESLDERMRKVEDQIEAVRKQVESAKSVRQDTHERQELIGQLEVKKSELQEKQELLAKYQRCGPKRLEELKSHCQSLHEAVNRWTDNIFIIQSWLGKKFAIDSTTLNKQFGIPENFDYITDVSV